MTEKIYDVAIIGAGAVGCAIARELSRYELNIALVESNPDVGMGTSKASTAIWHTGFDAKPGTLEATLMRRSYKLMDEYLVEANIAHERLGALLIAWNQAQLDALPALEKKAHENGVLDVMMISAEEIYQREPHINKGALGGLLVPGEGILCTYSVPLACSYQAVLNGAELFLNFEVVGLDTSRKEHAGLLDPQGNKIFAKYVINAAGLNSDIINNHFGKTNFKVTPRRGQLIVYDKLSRGLVNHVLLPVPTAITKGVLISPTVYGNILLGPTAEDLDDKSATQTTAEGLEFLRGKGREILPQLLEEEVTATYAGLRAATEHSDYQIEMDAGQRYLCVGGIRSTGISAALGIAEYAAELLRGTGLALKSKAEFKSVKLPTIGQAEMRPHQNAELIQQNAAYAEIICHCERVSRGELLDALNAPIPATTLDGLRRRTRASQGRCQGFNCHAKLLKTLSATEPTKSAETQKKDSVRSVPSVVDVLIVGAGPAGLAAAIELKKLGIKNVLVVEREPEAGGMPRFCHHPGFGREDLWRLWSGPRYAQYYRELAEKAGVETRTSTTILGWKDLKEKTLEFTSLDGLGEIHARAVLLATGIRERPRAARLIPGARPQGIYTTGSLQRFVHQENLPVGKRAVIVGAELVSLSALWTLMRAKVECALLATEDARHAIPFPYSAMKWALADWMARAPVVTNARVSNIFGRQRVEAAELTLRDGQVRQVECDTLVFTGDWIPENELARMAGLPLNPVTRGPVIDANFHSPSSGIFAAGNLLRGVQTAGVCATEGKQAAQAITNFLK